VFSVVSDLVPTPRTHPLAWPGVRDNERTYALVTHLTVLLYHVLLPVVPALVMWLLRRERSCFIDDHGRQAINFQLTLLVYALTAWILGMPTFGVAGFVGGALVYVLGFVGMVLAARASWKGRVYRYPMTIPFLRGAL
jgi:hypothetical protein